MPHRGALIEDIKGAITALSSASAATRATPWLDVDLSLPQLKTLFALHHLGAVRVGEVAHVLALSPNATTAVLDKLEQQGLVVRGADPADRRAVLVDLADAGAEQVARLQSAHVAGVEDLLEQLSMDELEALQRGLAALNRVIQAESRRR